MKARIRSIWSPDVEDLETWKPATQGWSLGITIIAGPNSGPGEESFVVTVCDPEWVRAQVLREGYFDGRHHLIVRSFDRAGIHAYLERRVSKCEGETWEEVAEKLGRLGYWEFEDYTP